MTVSARKATGQENSAPKRKFTVHIMQAWSRHGVRPLAAVKAGPRALWQQMSLDHNRAWERSAIDGAYRMLCWPSQSRLAAQLNVSVQTIRRWTRELEAAGLIEVVVVAKPGATSCLRRCNYALVAPMRVSSMQAPRKRAPQSARGFAREGYVRASRSAAGVGGVVLDNAHHTPTSRAAVLERREAENDAYIEKLRQRDPVQAAQLEVMQARQRAKQAQAERVQHDAVPALDTGDPVKIAAEVAMIVPNISLGKAHHMARTNPHALAQAITALMDMDTESLANPAGYLVGIFNNISKRDRIRGLSHAA